MVSRLFACPCPPALRTSSEEPPCSPRKTPPRARKSRDGLVDLQGEGERKAYQCVISCLHIVAAYSPPPTNLEAIIGCLAATEALAARVIAPVRKEAMAVDAGGVEEVEGQGV